MVESKEVAMKKQIADLEKVLRRPDNQVCADCANKTPRWASITFGTFVCLRCSGKFNSFLHWSVKQNLMIFIRKNFLLVADDVNLAQDVSFYWKLSCLTLLLFRIASPVRHPHHQDKVSEPGQMAWWQSWAHAGTHEQSSELLLGGQSSIELRQARAKCFLVRGQAILGRQVRAQEVGRLGYEVWPSDDVRTETKQVRQMGQEKARVSSRWGRRRFWVS